MKKLDLTGQRFGRWTVLKRGETKNRNGYWLCQCDCGRVASVTGSSLRNGSSTKCRSCGNRGPRTPILENRRLLECDGAVQFAQDWADCLGVDKGKLLKKVNRGYSFRAVAQDSLKPRPYIMVKEGERP